MTIPDTMRAVVLIGHGGIDQLVYREDWPTPQPGPDEVLVKIGACGLNNTDINTRTAWYSKTVRDGITNKGGKDGFAEAEAATDLPVLAAIPGDIEALRARIGWRRVEWSPPKLSFPVPDMELDLERRDVVSVVDLQSRRGGV